MRRDHHIKTQGTSRDTEAYAKYATLRKKTRTLVFHFLHSLKKNIILRNGKIQTG